MLTVWGTVSGANTIQFLGAALSLIILEFLLERLSLNERLLKYLDVSQGPNVPTPADLHSQIARIQQEVKDLSQRMHDRDVEARHELQHLGQSLGAVEETVATHIVSFFPLLTADQPGRIFHELRHLYALRGARLEPSTWSVEVGRGDTIRLWRDALIESRTWDALSSANDLWEDDERAISEGYQELQRRLGNRNRVRRVFVLEDQNALVDKADLINEQLKTLGQGNVHWILRDKLDGILRRRGLDGHPIAQDLDFAVVDDSYVLWFVLSESKQLIGSRLVNNGDTLTAARRLFDVAFANGHEI